ncbi:MAG: hypothetical protein Q9183_005903 [Haloplaca sp. 2 TL-2023]
MYCNVKSKAGPYPPYEEPIAVFDISISSSGGVEVSPDDAAKLHSNVTANRFSNDSDMVITPRDQAIWFNEGSLVIQDASVGELFRLPLRKEQFPYTRLAIVAAQTPDVSYLYHQIDDDTLFESYLTSTDPASMSGETISINTR